MDGQVEEETNHVIKRAKSRSRQLNHFCTGLQGRTFRATATAAATSQKE
jgi:hypothetical protein